MTDSRLPFLATTASTPYDGITKLPVYVLLDNVRSMYNVGSFFRTGDAAAIEKLILGGITAYPPKNQISKTALGAEETLPWEHHQDPTARLRELREAGVEIAAIETSVNAVDLFDWRPVFPVCLVFGHETDGVRPELMDLCDTHVRIPMLGRKHSLNVATAGGILLYELLRKFRMLRT
jgi:tRNA G18 (ribose-2'-O)-methylase SpoU